jgi:hypothetical protein
MADSSAPTRVMMAVNESSLKGYPHPSISCRAAFDWMLSKLVRSNADGFHLLFLHVQVPDEDGTCYRARLPFAPRNAPWVDLLAACRVLEVLDGMRWFPVDLAQGWCWCQSPSM